jgi:hypothetical protein
MRSLDAQFSGPAARAQSSWRGSLDAIALYHRDARRGSWLTRPTSEAAHFGGWSRFRELLSRPGWKLWQRLPLDPELRKTLAYRCRDRRSPSAQGVQPARRRGRRTAGRPARLRIVGDWRCFRGKASTTFPMRNPPRSISSSSASTPATDSVGKDRQSSASLTGTSRPRSWRACRHSRTLRSSSAISSAPLPSVLPHHASRPRHLDERPNRWLEADSDLATRCGSWSTAALCSWTIQWKPCCACCRDAGSLPVGLRAGGAWPAMAR